MEDALALFGERFEAEKKVMNHADVVAPPKLDKANSVATPKIPGLSGLAIPGLKLPGLLSNLQGSLQIVTETAAVAKSGKNPAD